MNLRYYLAHWTSRFLGSVKHFYMPGLYYWLYGDLTNHNLYKGMQKMKNRKNMMTEFISRISSQNQKGVEEEVNKC